MKKNNFKNNNLLTAIIVSLSFVGVMTVSCSDDNFTIKEQDNMNFSLTAPNGEQLANSIDDFKRNLSDSKDSKIEILSLDYFDTKEKSKLAVSVNYLVNGREKKVIILRNIKNLKFEKGTIISFASNKKTNKTAFGGDIYISCSGSGCCYPSGSLDTNTGTMTTSCKCEGGDNSQCVMKISDSPPAQ